MAININQQNGIWLGGGLLAYMFSGKLGPLKGIAKIGGIAAAGLGVLDIMGIFKIDQLKSMVPSFYGATNTLPPVGAYAVDVRNMQYDPNNYYMPPRTA